MLKPEAEEIPSERRVVCKGVIARQAVDGGCGKDR